MSHSALPPVADNSTAVASSTPFPAVIPNEGLTFAPVEAKVQEFFPPSARLWLYGVCVAALPLLVAYGKLSGDQVSLWTDFAASVLGVSGLTVAIANVKK